MNDMLTEKLSIVMDNQRQAEFKMREINMTVQNMMRLQELGSGEFSRVRKILKETNATNR